MHDSAVATRRSFLGWAVRGSALMLLAACQPAPASPSRTSAPAAGGAPPAGSQPKATAAPAVPAPAKPTVAAASRKSGGSLRVGVPLDVISLNPFDASSPSTRQIYDNLYETMVELNFDSKLQPGLAERWEQTSPTKTAFAVRSGLKFHTGNLCDANAIKAYYDRVLDPQKPGAPASGMPAIKSLAVEGNTLIIETDAPNAVVPTIMGHPANSIVDQMQFQRLGASYNGDPSGTGPFRFKEWKKAQSITMVRNTDYWRAAPALDEVVFRIIPEPATRSLAFQNNEVDVFYSPPGHLLSELKSNPTTQIISEVTFRTVYIGLNKLHEPFKDTRVRTALAHAINRKAISDFILEGIGIPAEGFVSPKVWGFAPVGLWDYNIDKSKQLLADAGWKMGSSGIYEKDGQPLKFKLHLSPEEPKNQQISEALQGELRKVGFDVSVQVFELAVFQKELEKMQHQAFLYASTAATGDIDHQMNLNWYDQKKDPPQNRNYLGFNNEVIQAATINGRAERDETKRAEIYKNAQQVLKDEVPWIPLYHPLELAAAKNYVRDFRLHPAQNLWFANVWLDK
jgi:peptide/nickel transport system substrate-binding protein